MSIMGNVVGLPGPQPDWNQEDSSRADYIRNKPDLEQLLGQGSGALSRTGGTMEGTLNMGGNTLTGLPEPENGSDAVTRAWLEAYIETVFLGGTW